MGQKILPGCRKTDFSAVPIEQYQSHLSFKLPDLHRHGRCSQMQGFGRARHAGAPSHLGKNLELTQRNVHLDITINFSDPEDNNS